jgi:hypothetical protein
VVEDCHLDPGELGEDYVVTLLDGSSPTTEVIGLPMLAVVEPDPTDPVRG